MLTESHILDYIDRLPSLPTTVSKMVELANNPASSPRDMIKVIKFDPVLTAKVLRLINSAYFGLPSKITSLTRAVILLGINTLKNLSISTSVVSAITIKKDIPHFNVDEFWEHSLGCAVASKLIGKKLGVDKTFLEEYFICGLTHDIGKILLVQCAPNDYETVLKTCDEKNTTIVEEEQNILGMTHTDIGGLIGKKWELAQGLIESIEEHHNPTFQGESVKMKTTVFIANILCRLQGVGFNIGEAGEVGLDSEKIWKTLGLSRADLEKGLITLPDEVEKAKVFLQKA